MHCLPAFHDPNTVVGREMMEHTGMSEGLEVTAVALGVFGTLTVQEVIDSGGTALAVAAEPVLGRAGYWMMTITALFATAGATNSGLYPAGGLCEQMTSIGQFPPLLGRRLGGRLPSGLLVTAARRHGPRRRVRPLVDRVARQRDRARRLCPGHGGASPRAYRDRSPPLGAPGGPRQYRHRPGHVRVHDARRRTSNRCTPSGHPRHQRPTGPGMEARPREPPSARPKARGREQPAALAAHPRALQPEDLRLLRRELGFGQDALVLELGELLQVRDQIRCRSRGRRRGTAAGGAYCGGGAAYCGGGRTAAGRTAVRRTAVRHTPTGPSRPNGSPGGARRGCRPRSRSRRPRPCGPSHQ